MPSLYTIGHSTYEIGIFLKLLDKHQINCVIDVRSTPFSKFAPQYNSGQLSNVLKQNKKYYIFMGEEFGARRSDSSLYTDNGLLDFNRVLKSELYLSGVKRVEEGLRRGYNIAFMCTEKDPIDCHRAIMVARGLELANHRVIHIHPDGSVETQAQLTERLLDRFFPDRNQMNIFELVSKPVATEQMEQEVYRLRNWDIAYKIETGDEGS